MIKTHNNQMGYTNRAPTHSHALPPTPIYSHPLLLIFYPLPFIFGSFTPTHTHVYVIATLFKPTPNYVQTLAPFPVHIQILKPNPTHHLPFQPIFSPCILRAYVLYVPVCLWPLCFTCPCHFPKIHRSALCKIRIDLFYF